MDYRHLKVYLWTFAADTVSDSLSHLTGDEQKAVKTTAFDSHLNPARLDLVRSSRSQD